MNWPDFDTRPKRYSEQRQAPDRHGGGVVSRQVQRAGSMAAVVGLASSAAFAPASAIAADCRGIAEDVTVPDYQQVEAGQRVHKVWRVPNCGDAAWDQYRAVRVDGAIGPATLEVPLTRPGAKAELSTTLVAPSEPGCHAVGYRLEGPHGQFGAEFGALIVVPSADSPAQTPPTAHADDALALAISGAEIGDRWCSVESTADVNFRSASYANYQEYGGTVRLSVEITRWPSAALADANVQGLVHADSCCGSRVTQVNWRPLGDGFAAQFVDETSVAALGSNQVLTVHDVFRVGGITANIRATGAASELADLESIAARAADVQEARLWARLGDRPAPSGPHCRPGQPMSLTFAPFRRLQAVMGDGVGAPVDCATTQPSGNVEQLTTTGLLAYLPGRQEAIFTNGSEHWALVEDELVRWTEDMLDSPATAEPSE